MTYRVSGVNSARSNCAIALVCYCRWGGSSLVILFQVRDAFRTLEDVQKVRLDF